MLRSERHEYVKNTHFFLKKMENKNEKKQNLSLNERMFTHCEWNDDMFSLHDRLFATNTHRALDNALTFLSFLVFSFFEILGRSRPSRFLYISFFGKSMWLFHSEFRFLCIMGSQSIGFVCPDLYCKSRHYIDFWITFLSLCTSLNSSENLCQRFGSRAV